jgi:hypothetical protein
MGPLRPSGENDIAASNQRPGDQRVITPSIMSQVMTTAAVSKVTTHMTADDAPVSAFGFRWLDGLV